MVLSTVELEEMFSNFLFNYPQSLQLLNHFSYDTLSNYDT